MEGMIVPDISIHTDDRVRMRLALELSLVTGLPYADHKVTDALERTVDGLVRDAVVGGAPQEFMGAMESLVAKVVEDEAVSMYLALNNSDAGGGPDA